MLSIAPKYDNCEDDSTTSQLVCFNDNLSPEVNEKLGFVYDKDDIIAHVEGIRHFESCEYYLN